MQKAIIAMAISYQNANLPSAIAIGKLNFHPNKRISFDPVKDGGDFHIEKFLPADFIPHYQELLQKNPDESMEIAIYDQIDPPSIPNSEAKERVGVIETWPAVNGVTVRVTHNEFFTV